MTYPADHLHPERRPVPKRIILLRIGRKFAGLQEMEVVGHVVVRLTPPELPSTSFIAPRLYKLVPLNPEISRSADEPHKKEVPFPSCFTKLPQRNWKCHKRTFFLNESLGWKGKDEWKPRGDWQAARGYSSRQPVAAPLLFRGTSVNCDSYEITRAGSWGANVLCMRCHVLMINTQHNTHPEGRNKLLKLVIMRCAYPSRHN